MKNIKKTKNNIICKAKESILIKETTNKLAKKTMKTNGKWVKNAEKQVSKKELQRVQLLIRNKIFIEELYVQEKYIAKKYVALYLEVKKTWDNGFKEDAQKSLEKYGIFSKLEQIALKDYASRQTKITLKSKSILRKNSLSVFFEISTYLSEFYERWGIATKWNGDIETLWKFAKGPIEFYCDDKSHIEPRNLLIRISKWTTLNDIKRKWKDIQKLQKSQLGKAEERAKFERDLAWYDMKQEGYKIKKIIDKEKKDRMNSINMLVVNNFKQYIAKEDLKGKKLDNKLLVGDIMYGSLSKKYKKLFNDEKEYYITGKIPKRGKFVSSGISPLEDLIKKAIKRTKKEIDLITPLYFYGNNFKRCSSMLNK